MQGTPNWWVCTSHNWNKCVKNRPVPDGLKRFTNQVDWVIWFPDLGCQLTTKWDVLILIILPLFTFSMSHADHNSTWVIYSRFFYWFLKLNVLWMRIYVILSKSTYTSHNILLYIPTTYSELRDKRKKCGLASSQIICDPDCSSWNGKTEFKP